MMRRAATRWVVTLTLAALTCAAITIGTGRAADVWPNCSWNCTAKDVELTSAYATVPGGTCEPGTLITATITGVFSANATRYAVWVLGDVYVNGGYKSHIQDCVAGSVSPPGGSFVLATLTWPCGSSIELRNLVVSWTTGGTCGDAPTCTNRTAKCSAPSLGSMVVATPLVVDFASNAPKCLGTPIGFTSVVTGGTTPYTYAWTFGDGTGTSTLANPTYTYAAPGTYTVTLTVRDSAGGADSHSYNVVVRAVPLTSETHANVACFGGATGSIDLTVTSGTAPYAYLWTNGATTQDLSGLAAGTYSVTVTDANGCTATRSVTVTQPSAPLALSATHIDVACFSGSTGSIDLSVTGGTAPYSYLWSNGATTQDLSGLTAGTYSVTVTDANGCRATRSVTITQPSVPLALSATHIDVACFGGSTGSIDLSVTGGTAPYSYLWSNGATTQDLSALAAGMYSVTVTDAGGCTAGTSATVSQPGSGLSLSATHVDVACFGGSTGSIDLSVTGGTAPYSYLWSNGATTQDLSGLAAGAYSVTVTDANGCTATKSVTITQPGAALSLSATHVDVACFGGSTGSIDLSATGGTAPYSYLWSNGATTQDATNLAAGVYTVVVTDANGCVASLSTVITQPTAPLTLSGTHTDVACFGGSTGSISLSVSGGTPPVVYSWSNGAATQGLVGLTAETYSVTVTDANGCTASWSVTIDQPAAALAISATHADVGCYGGATGWIDLSVAGGTAPYAYLWSNGSMAQDLSGLVAGTYSVLVTDANGCSAAKTQTITQPAAALSLTDIHTNVSCTGGSNGSINLSVAGGTAPYAYAWSTGATTQDLSGLAAGTYTVTVTDENGCTATRAVSIGQPAAVLAASAVATDVACYGEASGSIDITVTGGTPPYSTLWSNGATTQDLTGIPVGSYSVTVTDARGCVASATAGVAGPPSPLVASVDPVAPLLVGDPLQLAAGPAGMASYVWSGPNGYMANVQNPTVSSSVTLAMAGVYMLTVTDANGCTGSASTEVTISAPPACTMTISFRHVDVACYGGATGAIDISVSGGTPPYAYSWSNGASTQDLAGLAAGTYICTVTDSAGCSDQVAVVISQPLASLALRPTSLTHVSCFGEATGSVTVRASGGTEPYRFSRDGAIYQTNGTFDGLAAGVYVLTVRDAVGCDDSWTIAITQPDAPLAVTIVSQTDAACYGERTGSVTVAASGGTPPYVFSKDGGTTEQPGGVFGGLSRGDYAIEATDANGCRAVGQVTVGGPDAPIALSDTHVDVACFDGATGSIDLTVSGGTPPYRYTWSSGAASEDLDGLTADTYVVVVTDASGCSAYRTVLISQPAAPLVLSDAHADVACFGAATGAIDLTTSGGTPPYTYAWSNGASVEDQVGLRAGTYSVTVIDSVGCPAGRTVVIAQPNVALVATIAPAAALAIGQPLTLTGGPAGMASYSWTGPNGFVSSEQSPVVSASATAEAAGTYTLNVVDVEGCSAQASVVVALAAGFGGGCTRGIVISEIAWAGTQGDPEAEWIELRNLLEQDVDLTGWELRWRLADPQTPGETGWKTLPLSGTIGRAELHPALTPTSYTADPADHWLDLRVQRKTSDFFLLERVSDETVADVPADLIYDAVPLPERMLDLSDAGEIVQLVDPTGCVIDTANRARDGIGGWISGDEETAATMERTDPGREDVATNWHTNLGIITFGVDRKQEALFGTAGVLNQPLLETGIEEVETTALPLTASGFAEALPGAGATNDGRPTRVVTLREESDLPVPATYSVVREPSYVVVIPTSPLPPGTYEVWVRIGETVLLTHVQVE